jgi:hypothetical protein
MGGNQLHTGDTIVDRGVFGLGASPIGMDAKRPVLEVDVSAGAEFTIGTSTSLIYWTDLSNT